MQSFRKSYGLVFEIVSGADDFSRYVFWVTATRGPSPSWQRIEQKKNSQPPSGYRANAYTRYTSSKGMPRHAYGRWALMRVCGVDVGDVRVEVVR